MILLFTQAVIYVVAAPIAIAVMVTLLRKMYLPHSYTQKGHLRVELKDRRDRRDLENARKTAEEATGITINFIDEEDYAQSSRKKTTTKRRRK